MRQTIVLLGAAAAIVMACFGLIVAKIAPAFPQQMSSVTLAPHSGPIGLIDISPTPLPPVVTTTPARGANRASEALKEVVAKIEQQTAQADLEDRRNKTPARAPLPVVPDNYYSQWSDLIAKCWASVSNNTPFDDTGLVAVGTEQLSDTGYSRQKWRTADRIYTVTYTHESTSRAGTGIDRTCSIKTWRQPFSAETVQALKDHYDDWFARERLEAASVFAPYRWTLREGDQYHAANTTFGSAQGCRMYMSYRDIVFGSDTEAQFFLTELTDEDCDAPNGASATAGVRVNRLPQITD